MDSPAQLLYANKKIVISRLRGLGSIEVLEDAISVVIMKVILNKTLEIPYPYSFLYSATRNEVLNQKRNSKWLKYEYVFDTLSGSCEYTKFEDFQDLNHTILDLMTVVKTLTKGQQRAIQQLLKTGQIYDPTSSRSKGTQKSAFAQAIRDIRSEVI